MSENNRSRTGPSGDRRAKQNTKKRKAGRLDDVGAESALGMVCESFRVSVVAGVELRVPKPPHPHSRIIHPHPSHSLTWAVIAHPLTSGLSE